jgi:hypothetical protein
MCQKVSGATDNDAHLKTVAVKRAEQETVKWQENTVA